MSAACEPPPTQARTRQKGAAMTDRSTREPGKAGPDAALFILAAITVLAAVRWLARLGRPTLAAIAVVIVIDPLDIEDWQTKLAEIERSIQHYAAIRAADQNSGNHIGDQQGAPLDTVINVNFVEAPAEPLYESSACGLAMSASFHLRAGVPSEYFRAVRARRRARRLLLRGRTVRQQQASALPRCSAFWLVNV